MLTDELRNQVWNEVRQCDCRAFTKFLQPQVFAEVAVECGVTLGASQVGPAVPDIGKDCASGGE